MPEVPVTVEQPWNTFLVVDLQLIRREREPVETGALPELLSNLMHRHFADNLRSTLEYSRFLVIGQEKSETCRDFTKIDRKRQLFTPTKIQDWI